MSTVQDSDAAANCRAILAQLTFNGKVNANAFIHEMNTRCRTVYKKKLRVDQVKLLRRIVEVYERELRS